MAGMREAGNGDKRTLTFFVRGLPRPQGSGQPRLSKSGKPFLVTKTANLTSWRHALATVLSWEWHWPPIDGPVALSLIFVFPRPKSAPKRVLHTVTPDEDKLARAVLDAFKGVVFTDDSRVYAPTPIGIYGDEPGVHVYICESEETAQDVHAFYLEHAERVFDLLKGATEQMRVEKGLPVT